MDKENAAADASVVEKHAKMIDDLYFEIGRLKEKVSSLNNILSEVLASRRDMRLANELLQDRIADAVAMSKKRLDLARRRARRK